MAPRLWNARTRLLAAAASLALLGLALPASAEDVQVAATNADTTDVDGQITAPTEEYVRPDVTPEEARNWWAEYGKNIGNRYMVAFNSLITFPADPVMDTVKPREEFEELPLADYGPKYVAGLGTGLMLSMYRASTGVFDVAFGWLPPMKMLSPEPRYMVLPGEHPEF
jgi:hypothetical protein